MSKQLEFVRLPKTDKPAKCDKHAKKNDPSEPKLGFNQVTEIVTASHALKIAKKQLEEVKKDLEELEEKKKKLLKRKKYLEEEVHVLKKALQTAQKPVK
jgi:septal ring factor EnvC (AmiA/AmiB activator)